jgi:hypothetical protein
MGLKEVFAICNSIDSLLEGAGRSTGVAPIKRTLGTENRSQIGEGVEISPLNKALGVDGEMSLDRC